MPVAAPVVPIAAPVSLPVAVPTPVPVATPAEMILTEGDAEGAALLEIGDFAEASTIAAPAAEVEIQEAPKTASTSNVQPSSLQFAEDLQRAAVDALSAAKNQATPADALSDAEWTVTDTEIRVQTELSKTMLSMVINPEAEKLTKAALRDAGAGAFKLVLLPGVKNTAAKKPRAAKNGSAQAKAMEHPIVQRAQTLFNAEIRNVIDLRDND